jgi:hypothetical protein
MPNVWGISKPFTFKMQEKPVYVVVENSPEVRVKKTSAIIKYVLFACLAAVVVVVILFFPTSKGYSSSNASSKAPGITARWENCTAASTCETGYTCCAAYADLDTGKTTCRQAGLAPNAPLGCGSTTAALVKEWDTCYAGSTCANGFTCCVAPADVAEGKRTCRQPGLAPNAKDGCAAASTSSTLVPKWQTCFAGSTCANGFTCCVAPADVAEGKTTCRQPGLAPNAKDGCASSTLVRTVIPAWENCTMASTCATGFTCCVGPLDVGVGKLTCRQSGLAVNAKDGCAATVTSVSITYATVSASRSASASASVSASVSASRSASRSASASVSASVSASASPQPSQPPVSQEITDCLNAHNTARSVQGLTALVWDADLAAASAVYSETLSGLNKLDHSIGYFLLLTK